MVIKVILSLGIGYLFGCFSTAYLLGKLYKVDIRNYGSGNAGTTNALRTLGAKAGVITLLGDMLKAIIAILLVRYAIFSDVDFVQLLTLYTGLGVVLGHNYPVWLGFKGGKGIAATAGVMVAFDPWIIPIGLPLFVITVALTRYVSVGSLVVAVLLPIWVLIRTEGNLHMLIVSLIFMILAFIKHRTNIKRLMNGTENKLGHRIKVDQK
ncbi:glycerol-3-phosphate 1-O-acyltransferase PlsY [Mobilitalea sibirica]|uniref:Glycerol-3-phosphate acyltransferase n=1 Tax=Mobilitalea sibirica TaxID=1462919 RepID=A0A8J7H170_9FIRM|nr:glycerol-3-phosphate 1-O-acyltransferase PlsY [Mobilitalea sibirica]MBH1942414.1 glycerol-3-phosphate 1-O-acyltransferase PlsY [Mobilitalea sibirica]